MNLDIETPFARVLNTNHIPSNEELDTLKNIILGPEEQIRKLDEEISRLQATRQALREFVNSHRALLSPRRRLPAEILASIFVECLPDNELGLCSRSTQDAPLLLTTICRQWREIALSTPKLWNSIHINISLPISFSLLAKSKVTDDNFSSFLRGRQEGFKAWLDRSGSLPITISLATDPQAVYQMENPYGALLRLSADTIRTFRVNFTELLAQYSHRWRTVAVGQGVGQVLDLIPFETLVAKDLSSLEKFYSFGYIFSRDTDEHEQTSTLPPARLLPHAHSLRHLKLHDALISAYTLSQSLPWHNLTELSISYVSEGSLDSAAIMRTLADQCQSLVTFCFDIREMRYSTLAHDAAEWPSLQNLCIKFQFPPLQFDRPITFGDTIPNSVERNEVLVHNRAVFDAFESVTLPSLVRLSLDFEDLPYTPLPDSNDPILDTGTLPFERLIQRSHCHLTHFELLYLRVGAKPLIRVLQSLETLVSLNLGHTTLKSIVHPTCRRPTHYGDFLTVQRGWLERIFRELLSTSSEDRNELPEFLLCPKLRELRVGGCSPDESDIVLDFAMKRPNLGVLRVDFGWVSAEDVRRNMDSQRMQEGTKMLREAREVVMDWKWTEMSKRSPWIDRSPTEGMPGDQHSWW
ncbi:hypothetical protein PM082_012213 [Marasmius tenuissimus]|nr:hypothetical protein PM082_012213 [Marasmius tenuissimus]